MFAILSVLEKTSKSEDARVIYCKEEKAQEDVELEEKARGIMQYSARQRAELCFYDIIRQFVES